MKSKIIASLVATTLFANAGYAESTQPEYPWVEVNSSDDTIFYVNVETVKDLSGGIKQAWEMSNYSISQKTSSGKIYQSNKIQTKYDCINETWAIIGWVDYSHKNGTGDVVTSLFNKPYEIAWRPVVPGTIGEATLKFVCAR